MNHIQLQISSQMDQAILSSDRSVSDVVDLSTRQQRLQTGFIMNENRVNSARDAAVAAKDLGRLSMQSRVKSVFMLVKVESGSDDY